MQRDDKDYRTTHKGVMKSLKILFLIPTLQTGGTERQICYLAKGLADKDHRVTVGTFYKGGNFWNDIKETHNLRIVSFDKNGKYDFLPLLRKMEKHLRKERYDVIQGFLATANIFGVTAGKLANVPVICMGERYSCSDHDTRTVGGYMRLWLEKILSHFADKVVYNAYSAKDYHERAGYPKAKSAVIWNGIDIDKIDNIIGTCDTKKKKEQIGLNAQDFIISIIGRVTPIKGHLFLLKALDILVDKGIKNIKLLIAGGGDKRIVEKLKRFIKAHKLENNVDFLGFRDDVFEIIYLSDIVVSSSSGEGVSNVIIESMACERPVVATDVGDNKLLLQENRGCIVSSKSPMEMALTMENLMGSQDMRREIAKRAKSFVKESLNLDRLVHDYSDLYMKLAGHA